MCFRTARSSRIKLRGVLGTSPPRHRLLCAVAPSASGEDLARRQLECIARLPDGRPATVGFEARHGRSLEDDVANAEECRRAVAAARRAMLICSDSDGDGRLFPPDIEEAQPLLGDDGFALFAELRARVRERVRARYGAVEPVNSLISWISGAGAHSAGAATAEETAHLRSFDWRVDPAHGTFAPHVDKANQSAYDVSALLYLTTLGADFAGGHFAFNDPDCDLLLEPQAVADTSETPPRHLRLPRFIRDTRRGQGADASSCPMTLHSSGRGAC